MNLNIGNIIVAVLVVAVSFAFYYGIIGYTLQRCGTFRHYKELGKRESLLITGLFAVLTLFFYSLCSQDVRIPNWDSGFYWIKNLNFSIALTSSPIQIIKQIYQSINLTDYSDVIPAIMAIPFNIFGRHSYVAYRVLLFIMFQIPSYFIIAEIVITLLKKMGIVFKNMYFIILFFCSSLSFMYIPTVYGLFDIADVVIAASIALLLLNMDYGQFNIKENVLLSVLFLLLLFLRRHFSFFALGYFSCYLVVEIVKVIKNKSKIGFINYIKNSLMIGGICSSILLIFFRDYLIRTLSNNYSIAYSARSTGNMADKFYATFSFVGWIVILFSIVGIVKLLMSKIYDVVIIQVVSLIFVLYMYFRIQDLSVQHYYNIAIQIFVLWGIGLVTLIGWCKKNLKIIIGLTEIAICLFIFIHGMVPSITIPNKYFLLPSLSYQPEKREDISEIGELVAEIKKLVDEEKGYAYCIASSGILNDDILRNYNLPEELNTIPELHTTCHTDLGNGFPEGFLTSKVVITTEPAQTHANIDGQRIIWILNNLINDSSSPMADNFQTVKTFKIGYENQKVKVIIYKKVKDFTEDDYLFLIDTFNEWYSEYPNLFENRIKKYM